MAEPKEIAERYPQSCPFCSIAAAYPSTATAAATSSKSSSGHPESSAPSPSSSLSSLRASAATPPPSSETGLSAAQTTAAAQSASLVQCIPTPETADPTRVQPSAFVVLSAPTVMAFLDILPMTRGHLLVTTREHRSKVEDVRGKEGRDVGFWLPLLAKTVAKVTGVTDYNIVQNNGARAAQVVPHVHFHIIPRPPAMPELKNKSWTMFGRGLREDLDDDEAVQLAEEMRNALREEVESALSEKSRL